MPPTRSCTETTNRFIRIMKSSYCTNACTQSYQIVTRLFTNNLFLTGQTHRSTKPLCGTPLVYPNKMIVGTHENLVDIYMAIVSVKEIKMWSTVIKRNKNVSRKSRDNGNL
jgi:hypothetical protein